MKFEDFDTWIKTSVKNTNTERIDEYYIKYLAVTPDNKKIEVIVGKDVEVYRLWFDDYHFYSDTAYERADKEAILSALKDIISALLAGHYYEVVYKRNDKILKRKLFLDVKVEYCSFIPRKVGFANRLRLLLPGVAKEHVKPSFRS